MAKQAVLRRIDVGDRIEAQPSAAQWPTANSPAVDTGTGSGSDPATRENEELDLVAAGAIHDCDDGPAAELLDPAADEFRGLLGQGAKRGRKVKLAV